jgi:hypothetical protein
VRGARDAPFVANVVSERVNCWGGRRELRVFAYGLF